MRGVIRNIFDDHLPTVLAEREGHDLSEREWRGVWCIATCRTAAQGTHVGKTQPWLHTSRAYGLYHPAAATMLTQARTQIQPAADASTASDTPPPAERPVGASPLCCPVCGRRLYVHLRIHGGQSPPEAFRQQQRERAA